jgi:anthranilate synthase/aminodeoxychorismate synthase-like glutamine amidotransferase
MARPGVIIVDHYDSYTWSLAHLCAAVTGHLPAVVQHDRVDVEQVLRFSHVILSPGPGRPEFPRDFAVGMDVVAQATVPVLGVCLGMQGLVVACGGEVGRVVPGHGVPATVSHDGVGVFQGVPQHFAGIRYHSLAVRYLPSTLTITASDDRTGLVMGVQHKDRPLAGVQFHPESILSEHGEAILRNFLQ